MKGSGSATDQATSALVERARTHIPGGVNSGQRVVPGGEKLVVASTGGSTFTDTTGFTYTDYHAAFGPPILGHNDPQVDDAVAQTSRRLGLAGVGVTEVEIELAEKIVTSVPSAESLAMTSFGSTVPSA